MKSKLFALSLRCIRRNQNIPVYITSISCSVLCTKSHKLIFSLIVVKEPLFIYTAFSNYDHQYCRCDSKDKDLYSRFFLTWIRHRIWQYYAITKLMQIFVSSLLFTRNVKKRLFIKSCRQLSAFCTLQWLSFSRHI